MREADRQLAHLNLGLFALLLLAMAGPFWSAVYVFLVLIILLLLTYYATHHAKKSTLLDNVVYALLLLFERPQDRHFEGATWYCAGLLLPITVLSPQHAAAAIFILAAGDAAATLVGRHSKNRLPYNKRKTLSGLLAFFLVSSFSYLVAGYQAIAASAICALVESANLRVDDNLTVSVAAVIVFSLL